MRSASGMYPVVSDAMCLHPQKNYIYIYIYIYIHTNMFHLCISDKKIIHQQRLPAPWSMFVNTYVYMHKCEYIYIYIYIYKYTHDCL